jgi:uncharacterized membrane protein YhhN
MSTLLFVAFIAAAALDWWAVSQERKPVEWIAKPAALAFLLLWAMLGSEASWLLLAALTFSLLGDVYLMLPANLFAAGLGAFLIGHLGYIGVFDAPLVWRLVWSAVAIAASAPVALRIVRAAPGALRGAVVAYMIVIGFMVGSAIASGSLIAAAGAVLFMVSDSMIAWNRFVAPFAGARVAIIITYHVGQLLLVCALR